MNRKSRSGVARSSDFKARKNRESKKANIFFAVLINWTHRNKEKQKIFAVISHFYLSNSAIRLKNVLILSLSKNLFRKLFVFFFLLHLSQFVSAQLFEIREN